MAAVVVEVKARGSLAFIRRQGIGQLFELAGRLIQSATPHMNFISRQNEISRW
jgi:hypothetical protein